VSDFVAAALDPGRSAPFLSEVRALIDKTGSAGTANALAQLLFKLTAPGVPDIYQGTEWWDLSLVDPDNRPPRRLRWIDVFHPRRLPPQPALPLTALLGSSPVALLHGQTKDD
jgi:maltooligosyltrehalose synthase